MSLLVILKQLKCYFESLGMILQSMLLQSMGLDSWPFEIGHGKHDACQKCKWKMLIFLECSIRPKSSFFVLLKSIVMDKAIIYVSGHWRVCMSLRKQGSKCQGSFASKGTLAFNTVSLSILMKSHSSF